MPRTTLRRSKRVATKRANTRSAHPRNATTKLTLNIYPDASTVSGPPQLNGNGELLSSHDTFGDFRVSKDFVISDPAPQTFIVVQKVSKTTVVETDDERLDTTDAIFDFTDERVNYMCDSYYEYFKIKSDGESVDYDKFQNGAIAKYNEADQVLDENDEGFVFNTGVITQIGVCACIKRECEECEKILALGWDNSDETPANGLPYLECNDENDALLAHVFSGTHSNVITHKVVVVWDNKSELNDGCPMSRVSNYINGRKK